MELRNLCSLLGSWMLDFYGRRETPKRMFYSVFGRIWKGIVEARKCDIWRDIMRCWIKSMCACVITIGLQPSSDDRCSKKFFRILMLCFLSISSPTVDVTLLGIFRPSFCMPSLALRLQPRQPLQSCSSRKRLSSLGKNIFFANVSI